MAVSELDMCSLTETLKPETWRVTRFSRRVQSGAPASDAAHTSSTNETVRTKTKIMNRLPCCDCTTRRSETAVFASLAFVGIATIVFAASAVVQFVNGSDRIVAALSSQAGSVAGKTLVTGAPATLTNVTTIQSRQSPTATSAPGKV